MRKINKISMVLATAAATFFLSSCSASEAVGDVAASDENYPRSKTAEAVSAAVDFEHEPDRYTPKKDHYNFYFTYKTVHPWWGAVALGMEDAQRQFLDKGVTITYEYMAPDEASAEDQTLRLRTLPKNDYDVIGVDVADEKIISPVLNEMADSGLKVMTFKAMGAKARL